MKEKYFCISKILSIPYVLVSVKLNIHLYKVVIWSTYKTYFYKVVIWSTYKTCPHKFSFTKCFPTKRFLTKRFLTKCLLYKNDFSRIWFLPQNVASHKIFTTKRFQLQNLKLPSTKSFIYQTFPFKNVFFFKMWTILKMFPQMSISSV